VGCCECGDEPSVSSATDLVSGKEVISTWLRSKINETWKQNKLKLIFRPLKIYNQNV
jgi:hypothetical protein